MALFLLFFGKLDAELFGARWAQCDQCIAEMNGVLHLVFISQSAHAVADNALQIRLPDVNYVVDGLPVPERRMNPFPSIGSRYPNGVIVKPAVVEVLIKKTELP